MGRLDHAADRGGQAVAMFPSEAGLAHPRPCGLIELLELLLLPCVHRRLFSRFEISEHVLLSPRDRNQFRASAHFRAELSFDGSLDGIFHTDVKKMTINPPQSFMDRLRQATQVLITETGREGRKRGNVEKGEIDHSIAETNIKRRAPLIPKPKALVERRSEKKSRGTHSRGDGDKARTPHLTNLKTVSGLKVVFNEGDYGQESPFYLVNQEGRTIIVTYNREHPFWRELVEHAVDQKFVATVDYLVFALANAELLVPESAAIVKTNVNATLVGLLV